MKPDFTWAFQESRAKTLFDWFCHRPAASSQHQLTRQPAGLTAGEICSDWKCVYLKDHALIPTVTTGLFSKEI
ncbi:hypothetical protein F511_29644 [Dorcoceras hygrometricum]|uniref:Uncharacterized protein n=1 Tax=Dorcoceras hygrometricum TaxID=472368 RepID=A0A2Z7CND7_9LAMI|nr:hypothetical protein F511_29644 [Dorcoceras hygrometricum]